MFNLSGFGVGFVLIVLCIVLNLRALNNAASNGLAFEFNAFKA